VTDSSTIDITPTPGGFAGIACTFTDDIVFSSSKKPRKTAVAMFLVQIIRTAGMLGQDSRDPTITDKARADAQRALVSLVEYAENVQEAAEEEERK
jgi:hypothetical protein